MRMMSGLGRNSSMGFTFSAPCWSFENGAKILKTSFVRGRNTSKLHGYPHTVFLSGWLTNYGTTKARRRLSEIVSPAKISPAKSDVARTTV